jgi:alpha-mannosidase
MSEDLNRRYFIKQAAIGGVSVAFAGASSHAFGADGWGDAQAAPARDSTGAWPPDASQYRLDLIAYAHIDPNFTFTETSAQFYKRSTYEIAFGYIERETDGHENPGQRWIDLTGKRAGREYGLAVINNAKYGYSVLNHDLRLSVVRGTVFAHDRGTRLKPDGEYIWQDQGIQTFRLWLAPHAGSWQAAEIVRLAEEYTAPTPVLYQGIHSGTRPQSGSFLSVDVGNVVVSALKKADEGNDVILRCYETDGRATTATLNLGFANRQWSGNFRPLEIKSLRIPMAGGPIREVNLLE